MSLLEFRKNGSAAYSVDDGLGALWDAAEKIGSPSLEMQTFGKRYRAEIMFRTSRGSTVYARGDSDERDEAMRIAISEAREIATP